MLGWEPARSTWSGGKSSKRGTEAVAVRSSLASCCGSMDHAVSLEGGQQCLKISSSTPRARRCGAGSICPTMAAGRPRHRHGARLLGGQGDVPRRASPRRSPPRARGAGVRQPQLRRQRRRATPGDRPLGADARLPRRDHLRLTQPRDRREPDRRLGLQLQRRARAGGRGDRSAGQVRRRQVPLVSGYRNVLRAGAGRHHRRLPGAMCDAGPRRTATGAGRRRCCRW